MSRAEKDAARAKKKEKQYGERIDDAYDESGERMSHEEAHRDSVYTLPPVLSQVGQCYMIQMKRFTKQRTVWLMLILLALIPTIVVLLKMLPGDLIGNYSNVNEAMSYFLSFMPLIGILMSCVICGSMLPQEFNERTVYLSLPLPMSRNVFYYGKFLSGLSLSIGVTTAAYGLAILVSRYYLGLTVAYTSSIFMSLIIALCGVFFCCSYTYMLSAKSKRGSSMKPFLILYVLFGIIGLVLNYISNNYDISVLGSIAGYIPTFSNDLALGLLGNSPRFSLPGILSAMSFDGTLGVPPGKNRAIMCAVCLLLGLACLIRGSIKTKRRDM